MEITSFVPNTSRSVSEHGSIGFRVAPLIQGEHVSAACIRLDPGGVIGRHEAVGRQIFAVVEGSAVVSGDDGVEYRLSEGQAAIWQPSEMHETRSEDGLVAIVIEGDI